MRVYEKIKEFGRRRWSKEIRPDPKSFHLQCCHCALVHELKFGIDDGDVVFRIRQKPRLTAEARRKAEELR